MEQNTNNFATVGGYGIQNYSNPNPYYNNPVFAYADPNAYYNGQLYGYNNNIQQIPQMINSLTDEEIKQIAEARPIKFDMTLDQITYLKSRCNHRNNHTGQWVVQQVNDGSGEVYCPICGERWDPTQKTQDEVHLLIKGTKDIIQNSKMIGFIPPEIIREYGPMIPLLDKMEQLYKIAVENFEKYSSMNPLYNQQDVGPYSLYESLMNGNYNQYAINGGAIITPQYYNQAYNNGAGSPIWTPGSQMGYAPAQAANPAINPMQIQPGAPIQTQAAPQYTPAQAAPYGMPQTGYMNQPQIPAPYGMQQTATTPAAPYYSFGQNVVPQPAPMAPVQQQFSPVFNPAQPQQQVTQQTQQQTTQPATEQTEQQISL